MGMAFVCRREERAYGMKKYQLSVVATSRNDDHGGSLTYRMQHFVNGFIAQCKRHQLRAELILVEWNPPEDRPPLAEALDFPANKGPCDIRIIRVPREIHLQFKYAQQLPLYQMIGKNVGIKRARGRFVLATNIDILFSDEVIRFMCSKLRRGCLYRADRLDIPDRLPAVTAFEELLAFCQNNYFRINGKFGTQKVAGAPFVVESQDKISLLPALGRMYQRVLSMMTKLCKQVIPCHLHTNGCGDFTLLSSQDWQHLRGYPEWDLFSFHIDSVLLYQAYYHGIHEIDLPRKMAVYHIEHGPGSGYSAEAAHMLFRRLEEKGVPYLEYSDLMRYAEQLHNAEQPIFYNDENWGLSQYNLEEIPV